jgi:hypothetical protein
MKLVKATSALAILAGALMGGCATYDRPVVATGPASATENKQVVVAEGSNGAMPYTAQSMFFKDRGLHYEDPSTLAPKIVEPVPRG